MGIERIETIEKGGPKFEEDMLTGVKTPEIRTVAPALFEVAKQVIESGELYDLILSDDASGRLVSLYLKRVLDGIYEADGKEKPDIRFVASGRHENTQTLNAIKGMIEKRHPGRTLLVTEYVDTGHSLGKLVDILTTLNLKFDVATVSSLRGEEGFSEAKKILPPGSDTSFFEGKEGNAGLQLYGKPSLSGVFKTPRSPIPMKYGSHRDMVVQARKDVYALAARVVNDITGDVIKKAS